MSISYGQAEFLAQLDDHYGHVVETARSDVRKYDAVVNRDVDSTYRAIEKAADRLVQKDRTMTRDAAITRVLRERPELYDDYQREFQVRQSLDAESEANLRHRINKAYDDREAVLDSYARTVDQQAELDALAKTGSGQVEESVAFGPIEREARALMSRDPALSFAQAVALACEQRPSLYDDYSSALNTGEGVDSPGGLVGTDDRRSGGRMFGADDREQVRKADPLPDADADCLPGYSESETKTLRRVLARLGPRRRNWLRKELQA